MPATVPIEKDKDIDKSHLEGELRLLYLMLLIRRFEERASQAYQQQKIGGFCHLYIGQEAVVVERLRARPDDYMITAYRDHAHALRGHDPQCRHGRTSGKATGISKGLGGSMHYFDQENTCMEATPSWAVICR
jgi:pyruvate dehydrogenase E1 component alpha subunit